MNDSRMDIDRARELVEQISENLATLPHDNPNYARLRQEVEELRAMLNEAEAHLSNIEERMKSVHGTFDRLGMELRADGIRAGVFLSEIGRILGLE
jgi:DNA repair exonuclease SbcCD ATPase subunit